MPHTYGGGTTSKKDLQPGDGLSSVDATAFFVAVTNKDMKREIKFRAWFHYTRDGEDTSHMAYGPEINRAIAIAFDGELVDFRPVIFGNKKGAKNIRHMRKVELMQFTGLKDKNGKEIYEGDVVRYHVSAPWDDEVPLEVRAEVVFDDPFYGCFCVKSMDGFMDATGCLYEYIDGIEVIGNIYENPELLK